MHFYGEIKRVDPVERMVWGYASTSEKASDGLTIDRSALEVAMDEYMDIANIREMHQRSAVGVAREAEMDEYGVYLGAHIVDDSAWAKVQAGVYRGFSIGAKVTERDNDDVTLVRGLKIMEISLVDRPADPGAMFDVFRRQEEDIERRPFSAKERKKDAKNGDAMPDGSFPIKNEKDLHNAIKLAGNAKNPAAARRHIKARARALGLSKLIPDSWGADRMADAVVEEDVIERDEQAAADVADAEGATEDVASGDAAPAEVEVADTPQAALEVLKGAVSDVKRKIVPADDPSPADLMRDALTEFRAKAEAVPAGELPEAVRSALQTAFDELVERGWLTKPEAPAADMQRVTELQNELDASKTERAEVVRQIKDLTEQVQGFAKSLEELPLPAKTAGALARAVEKQEDSVGAALVETKPEFAQEDVERVLAGMSEEDKALLLIRVAQKRPVPIRNR